MIAAFCICFTEELIKSKAGREVRLLCMLEKSVIIF